MKVQVFSLEQWEERELPNIFDLSPVEERSLIASGAAAGLAAAFNARLQGYYLLLRKSIIIFRVSFGSRLWLQV